MKKQVIKLLATVTFGLVGGFTVSQVNSQAAYKTVSVKKVTKAAYHKASNSGAFYNQAHTKKIVNLKTHPYTTYYVTKEAVMKNGSKKAVFYYAKSASGIGGWVWNKYLTKGKSPFGLKYAKSYLAMDAKTGEVLASHNGNTQRLVASTGKLMTIYLAVQKAEKENAWNKTVSVAGSGLRSMGLSSAVGGFQFKTGHKYTVKQLYDAALIESSNNAAIALGRWVSGSNAKFIKKMNAQAAAWGLSSKTKFVSASGLENDDLSPYGYWASGSYTAGNEVSAKDLATIARKLINDYPDVLKQSKLTSMKTDGQTLTNANRLLKGKTYYSSDLNVDGLKTGYTPRAGLCLVATSQKAGKHRLITVVLNDQNEFTETNSLMKHVYKTADVYK
ncbi:D-alanyl-D-alanine carboxypeptidase family protein [Lentilactobacillus senioris]|uniref:D-alanyl-D-alanine carboxypeptidase family protein n=1 Tax=Lentilactobacillus senioris TaxID=931534 RepID=UPI003D2BF086